MKWKRWLLVSLVVVLLLIGGLFVAAHIYLNSPAVARKVQEQLAQELGVPVQIGSADVSLFGNTTVHDVRLHESAAKTDTWLKVGTITTDISAFDILRGKVAPQKVTLKNVAADLNFDKEGNLLTRLPSFKNRQPSKIPVMPAITVDGAELTVHQQGRPAFVLRGADVSLTEHDHVMTLKGTINDPDWGHLTLDGHLGPEKGKGELILRGDRVHVTRERLESLPLVSPKVWQQVQAHGDTGAEIRFILDGSAESAYRVSLEPQGATIDVRAIHLHSTDTFGRILIVDSVVKLSDMRGQAADGQVLLGGTLDFSGKADKLHFDVTVKHARMEALAEKWNVPQAIHDIKGQLTGHADITITVGKTVQTEGQGEGKIEHASIADIPTDGPITLKLRYKNGQAEFSTEASSSALSRPHRLIPTRRASEGITSLALGAIVRLWKRQVANLPPRQMLPLLLILTAPPAAPAPVPPKVTYFDFNFGFKDIDIAQLLQRLNMQLPFPVSGRGSFHLHASLPINRPKDVALYKLTGTLDMSRLKAAGLELEKVTARLKLDKGVLQLTQLNGEWAGKAHFKGSAQARIAPAGEASAVLNLTGIPLDQLASVAPGLSGKVGGTLNADLNFRAPLKELRDPASWNAQFSLRTDRLKVFGWAVDQVSVTGLIKNGELTVPSIKGGLEGLQVTGSARATLSGHFPFTARVALEKADLAALERLARGVKLPVNVKGQLTLGASARGTLSPLAVDAGGDIEASSLQINKITVQAFSAAWKADTNTLKLDKIRAKLYEGQVTGSASAPLTELAPGSIDLRIANLDLGALTSRLNRFPVRLAGKANGTLSGKLSAALPGKPRELTSRVDIKSPRLRIQTIPADRLSGTVDYRNGVVHYKLEGETLGGTFDVEGQVTPKVERSSSAGPLPLGAVALVQAQPPIGSGRLRFRNLRLGRLWEALHIQGFLRNLSGRLDFTLNYQLAARPEDSTGAGTVALSELRWGDKDLTEQLTGPLRLRGERLTLPELSGIVGQGLFRATVGILLRRPERGWFGIHLEGVQAEQVFGVFPGMDNNVQGSLDVNIRGHMGERWQGTGEAVLAHGKVFGAEIAEWRLPFSFEFGSGESGGRLDVRDTHAQIGLGRAEGELHASFDGSMRLNGRLRFLRVELRNVFRSIDETLPVGAGRVSGQFTFSGQDVRSLNDVSGRLMASFAQSQALEFPGLRQIAPYLRLAPSWQIGKGDLRGYLSRGILRIDRLALSGQFLKLFADGTILIANGRLNLAVVARTGVVAVAGPVLSVLGVAAVGPVPVAVLVRASAWLSNWTIRLRVSGTLRSPSVQVEPLTRLLTEEVIRFFLFQYTLPFDAASSFLSGP